MELVTLIVVFCVTLSFMLAPCVSDQVNVQKSFEHSNYAVHHTTVMLPLLSRKLKLNEDAILRNFADKDLMPHKKLMEASPGNKLHEKEENVMNSAAEKGTWREWVNEGPNKSEYFTMDYGWVRRRRPIHNKQIPFAP